MERQGQWGKLDPKARVGPMGSQEAQVSEGTVALQEPSGVQGSMGNQERPDHQD